ncbi:hypothetical protein EJ04DRAFT_356852 [Polyplosphaeria fusca]|uniref:Uncharacterized protein n=1 Tax=Polyplosphaeria fusca TaxID=682080 RepID=A0A9P4V5Z9_9PLEO|nr:hypothetical protein EJ04DRAFT_356852 [Polyplosphaeria fusca]
MESKAEANKAVQVGRRAGTECTKRTRNARCRMSDSGWWSARQASGKGTGAVNRIHSAATTAASPPSACVEGAESGCAGAGPKHTLFFWRRRGRRGGHRRREWNIPAPQPPASQRRYRNTHLYLASCIDTRVSGSRDKQVALLVIWRVIEPG